MKTIAKTFFTVSKSSGLFLNTSKDDFNTKTNPAKFETIESAGKWINDNNHLFIGIQSKDPVKLSVNTHTIK